MADIMFHEGDSVGDPPQLHPTSYRIHAKRQGYLSMHYSRKEVPKSSRHDYVALSKTTSIAVCAAVNGLAVDCYRDYKLKVYNHLKEHGPRHSYGELSAWTGRSTIGKE
ncbi:Uncharacterized protein Adt_27499 [Abeliophyllum distichum]|uniref:Uncharacterized protein n=1 Tax=Abeliophyllum distichum TaxID=126358 RepID=A0ABD1RTX8_9LAMI